MNDEFDNPDNIFCPICEELVLNVDSFEEDEICEHTIFIATNEGGFEFIHDDFSQIINNSFHGNLEDYLDNLPIESLKIEHCLMHDSYYGFVNTK